MTKRNQSGVFYHRSPDGPPVKVRFVDRAEQRWASIVYVHFTDGELTKDGRAKVIAGQKIDDRDLTKAGWELLHS